MLKTATIHEIATRLLTKRHGHLIVTTRYYPRGLPRQAIHEYISALSPSKPLLRDFKTTAKRTGHNAAFKYVHYLQRFVLSATGVEELRRISELSKQKDVYLACYCSRTEMCHRELLLLMAHELYGAPIEKIKNAYPGFVPERAVLPESDV